jgi:hypothetical protein
MVLVRFHCLPILRAIVVSSFGRTNGRNQGHFAMQMPQDAVTLPPRPNPPAELTSSVLVSSGQT